MSPDQAYLSLFPISRSFDTLSVYEYSIEAAEAFEDALIQSPTGALVDSDGSLARV